MKTFLSFKKIHAFYFLFILLFSAFLPPNLTYAATGVPKILNFQGRFDISTIPEILDKFEIEHPIYP